jgi:hypothetical protein
MELQWDTAPPIGCHQHNCAQARSASTVTVLDMSAHNALAPTKCRAEPVTASTECSIFYVAYVVAIGLTNTQRLRYLRSAAFLPDRG